jgi:DNA-binding LytR/AlgR family response regulator
MNEKTLKETYGEPIATIIAGLYLCDQPKIVRLLENLDKVMYIEGQKHDKVVYYCDGETCPIRINSDDLDLLLPAGDLTREHESFWININYVLWIRLYGRDLKAMMANGRKACIRRQNAKSFKEKCRERGIGRGTGKKAD